ncbi:helix-turn-helix domain-containing protein [Acinetobacter junii]|uniref:Putative HTH-type transcriptional regulator n=1 Tax=Acinetobacter venetianus TaxID=52133 RepID=A0A150I3Y3_9GAMM|nr:MULTISPECIES: XRE family transcriptional regulator [Acinetobacter]KXZ74212.1 putative HTH-type transcriptional regulator [Acinetobacter venetianus]MCU4488961.1 helix-turn-helix domain-containing protein [Acinetobacter ursingii]MDI6619938.1 XRE family transcriptional regulator [Acinetobacter junii]MEB8380653.1 helix-turn-helix domain-containing protein [Acinetobacter junii]WAU72408.1 XRE family transcriptional regulator [Acinetobacter sp. TR11]
MATLGENLKKLRKAKKMTQKELAQKSGVKQSVISDLETGNAKSTGSILELANALGVTAEELKKGITGDFDNNVVPVTQRLIPVLSWVQAGSMTSVEAINPNDVMKWLPPLSADDPDGCFYLKVVGISNFPQYEEGDYILVNPAFQVCDLLSEDLIVVRHNSDATFKKLVIESDERKYLQALNPNFQPNIIEFEDGMELVGLVIDAFRPLGGSRPKRVRKS